MESTRDVTVFEGDKSTKFTIQNNVLSLETLKWHYPLSNGLIFFDAEKARHGLLIKDGHIIIVEGIDEYYVQNTSTQQSQCAPKVRAADATEEEFAVKSDVVKRADIIKDYFYQGYSYEKIRNILDKNYKLSVRHIQRIIKSLNLKRKKFHEDFYEAIVAILNELNGSGICLGYKAMYLRLKRKYGLNVYRSTVLLLLHLFNPEGIEERSRYRLKRRLYKVSGPNFLWHIDGYDKLKPYGFPIHGCVDGFSRKIMWLRLGTTNNKPEVISYYYLTAVKKHMTVPTLIRSDHGTENSLVEVVHQSLRLYHGDILSGIKSFVKGKSTSNQRIESTWGRLRRYGVNYWILYFKDMIEKLHFDKSNPMQVECLRFCFAPLIQYDLDLIRQEWNRHPIRKQDANIKAGKPNYLYYLPTESGGQPCGFPVEEDHVRNALKHFTEKPLYCSPEFVSLVYILLPNCETPKNTTEARTLYHKILNIL